MKSKIKLKSLKKKLVKQPKAELISKRNLLKELKKSQGYKLVREVEEPKIVPDNRSLYFKESYTNERKKFLKL